MVYGLDSEATHVLVQFPDLRNALSTAAGRNAILTLDIEGHQEMGIVKEIQWHPYREEVLHVDFLRINRDQDVTVEVRITIVGEAHELTLAGGILDQSMFSLTLTTKPHLIPDQIEVDVTHLQIGDNITVGDLQLPEGASTAIDPDTPVLQGSVARIAQLEEVTEDGLEEGLEEGAEAAAEDGAGPAGETSDEA